jgi:hypothetical protein
VPGLELQRAREDFDAGRQRALWRSLRAALTGRGRTLLPMEEVLAAARQQGRAFAGEQEIPLDSIAGTAASDPKSAEFDDAFLPVDRRLRDRWQRIYTAMTEGDELPPIEVYQLGDSYFVVDGHRRVSVARSLHRPTIPARVTEIRTRAPVPEGVGARDLLQMAEYASFLELTELDRTRPQARLEVSRLGRYDDLLAHILGHRYFLGLDRGEEVPLSEAAASWYDNVFVPVQELIRRHDLLRNLPGWTECDAYVELTRRWLALSSAGAKSPRHAAAHQLFDAKTRGWWRRTRLAHHLRAQAALAPRVGRRRKPR